MYNILQKAHSGWAYLTLLGIAVALFYFIRRYLSKSPMGDADRKVGLLALIVTHVQFLMGAILLFVSPITQAAFSDMGAAMKNPISRLYAVEHPLTMIISVILVTIAFRKVKAGVASGQGAGAVLPIFYAVTLLLMLSRIPWSAWMG